jgi:hypothetical protein
VQLRSYRRIYVYSFSFYGGAYYIERFATSTVHCSIPVQNPTLSGDMLMQAPIAVPIYAEPSGSSAILGMTTVDSSFDALAKNYDSDWYIGRALRDDNQRVEGWLQGTTLDLNSCNNLGGMPLYQEGEITPTVDCASVDSSNIAGILSPYNVQIADIGNWDDLEFIELCKAVTKTADALYKLVSATTSGTTYDDSAHAFRIIMADNPNSENDFIVFEQNYQTTGANNTPVPAVNCITSKSLDTGGRSASINCGQNSGIGGIIPEYTFVHELGHVFVGRTLPNANDPDRIDHPCYVGLSTVSFNTCVEKPTTNGAFRMRDIFVWGNRSVPFKRQQVQARIDVISSISGNSTIKVTVDSFTYDVAGARCPDKTENDPVTGVMCSPVADWLRGTRGWGSAAPQFIPCGSVPPANFVPTPFQQNPCVFVSWLQTDTGVDAVTEIEETAADLFLNWVYRQQTPASGFANANWADWIENSACLVETDCTDAGITNIYPLSTGPGDERYAWMNQILTAFATYYGW